MWYGKTSWLRMTARVVYYPIIYNSLRTCEPIVCISVVIIYPTHSRLLQVEKKINNFFLIIDFFFFC